ncbi:MAG: hypothetical protein A3G75_12420 [Verrucomicrobia bacterium RIFCSPLOWO2_12_FULL_64_8]|nr:MAG: hypothetical protein A3G75_12420 [Verrucomicrobia bacterium RIFCSPLOWO2_12_FULL_64_8]
MNYFINLAGGWTGFLGGAASGALIGLFFHRDDWLGGYGSFPRRMVRLGHIACWGLGLINILFALSCQAIARSTWTDTASVLLLVGLVTMPTNCFLTAWRNAFRHLFFLPAGSTLGGILCLLVHWMVAP